LLAFPFQSSGFQSFKPFNRYAQFKLFKENKIPEILLLSLSKPQQRRRRTHLDGLNVAKRLNGLNVLNGLSFYSDMSAGQDASSLP
jgi:hypothetical protein